MMLDERLFDQEWIAELPPDARWLFLYILAKASRKTGIFEMNMRVLNFGANTQKKYTAEDLLRMYGNRIQRVPGYENTGIIVDYIATNWCKGGASIDNPRNPLYRAIVNELARYGLTIEKVNEMAKKKIGEPTPSALMPDEEERQLEAQGEEENDGRNSGDDARGKGAASQGASAAAFERQCAEPFERFWKAYPGPRKTDKQKCLALFVAAARKAVAKGTTLDDFVGVVIAGIEKWKSTDDWQKEGGRYICAPSVWLRNKRWNAEVQALKGGVVNGGSINGGRGRSANANYQDAAEARGVFG